MLERDFRFGCSGVVERRRIRDYGWGWGDVGTVGGSGEAVV